MTLSGAKSITGAQEVLIFDHMCKQYGHKPSPTKVIVIQKIEDTCTFIIEVHRFLGACVFDMIWLPHYAHVADVLYQLLRKGQKFFWKDEHTKAIQKLKKMLLKAPTLQKVDYKCGRPIILKVDTTPMFIGWAIGKDVEENQRYVVCFGAKILLTRQRDYPQVKRELLTRQRDYPQVKREL